MNLFLALSGVLGFMLLYLVSLERKKTTKRSKNTNPPEAAGAWPIIGHLHHLLDGTGDQILHRKLAVMADKYGPVFTLRLGKSRAFVVSSLEVAKECFTVNDRVLSSRPEFSATKHLCYNNSMFNFAPYGPLWRDMRKTATLELLSARRLELLKPVRITEVDAAITELYNLWKKSSFPNPLLVDLQEWFNHLTLNLIVRVVAGKRYCDRDDDEARRCKKGVAEFLHLYGASAISDQLPRAVTWLDLLGHEKAMKKTAKELDEIAEGWVEEHRRRRRLSGDQVKGDNAKDFIDVMLSLKEEGELSNFSFEPDILIKSTCLNVILAANDTTTATLTWAMALLLNNPHELQKAQEELDFQVGLERVVDESDIINLPYLQAIVKETLRLYPVAPLSTPREATDNCTIAGFDVPVGTRVMFNVWKIQRDPKVWEKPSKFFPERFLTSHAHIDLRSQNSEILSFGGGRRGCPGVLFAIQLLHLTLARLLQAFEVTSKMDQPIDMTESPGLTTPKATPLEVLLTPRLAAKFYCSE